MKASWGTSEAAISSREQLEAIVETIRASGQPTMVFLEAEDGTVLVFGVGHEESVLTFVESDGTSFHSLGNPEREGFLLFLCREEIEEFMTEMAVPERIALHAAEQFLTAPHRPSGVTWEPDWGE